MQGTTTELLLVLVLITLSAFFSATETAYSSLNRARLKSLADRGQKRAADTLALADRYDELLSTILVGNNIVNIALASVGAVMFVRWLGDAGVGVSTAVVTVFVLIFGEISPKSLAKEVPERFAMAVYPLIRVFVTVLKPVNWLFTKWKMCIRDRRHAGHALLEDFRAGLHGAGLGSLRQYDVLYVSPGLGFDCLDRGHVLFLPDVLKYRGCICFQPL